MRKTTWGPATGIHVAAADICLQLATVARLLCHGPAQSAGQLLGLEDPASMLQTLRHQSLVDNADAINHGDNALLEI